MARPSWRDIRDAQADQYLASVAERPDSVPIRRTTANPNSTPLGGKPRFADIQTQAREQQAVDRQAEIQRSADADLKRQQATEDKFNREREAAAKAARARQVRAAAAQGIDTKTDIQTGERSIKTLPSGLPAYKVGEVGEPREVPAVNKAIGAVPILGDIATSGLVGPVVDYTGKAIVQDYSNEKGRIKTQPLPTKTDPKTGVVTTTVKDSFGIPGPKQVGVDHVAVQTAERAARIEQGHQAALLRKTAYDQAHAPFAPKWDAAQKNLQAAEVEKNKRVDKAPFKQLPNGRWQKIDPDTGAVSYPLAPEVKIYTDRKKAAEQEFQKRTREHEALAGQAANFEKQKIDIASQYRLNRIEAYKHKMGMPDMDNGTAEILAKEAGMIDRTSIDDAADEMEATNSAIQPNIGKKTDENTLTPTQPLSAGGAGSAATPTITTPAATSPAPPAGKSLIPTDDPGKIAMFTQAAGAIHAPENVTVETRPSGITWLARNGDNIGYLNRDKTGNPFVVVGNSEEGGKMRANIRMDAVTGVPIYLREREGTDSIDPVAGAKFVTQALQIIRGNPLTQAGPYQTPAANHPDQIKSALKQIGATPDQISAKVRNGELSVQQGQTVLSKVWGSTLKADDPTDPAALPKWLAKQDSTTKARWTGAANEFERNAVKNDFFRQWVAENSWKPGVDKAAIEAAYKKLIPAKDQAFFGVVDAISAIADLARGTTTAPAALYRAVHTLKRPDTYSPFERAAFESASQMQTDIEKRIAIGQAEGTATTVGNEVRKVGLNLPFSGISGIAYAAGRIIGGMAGKPIGAAIGGISGAPAAGVGAAPGAVIGAMVGGKVVGTAVGASFSAGVAYRMAGAQFMWDAFKDFDSECQRLNSRPMNEQEKQAAYKILLPLAQSFGKYEAAPEALGNAIMFGVGKYVFGGVTKAKFAKLSDRVIRRTGAVAGGVIGETLPEGYTQVGQNFIEQQAKLALAGIDPYSIKEDWSANNFITSTKQVFPQVVATMMTMGLITGGPKLGSRAYSALKGKPPTDPTSAPDMDPTAPPASPSITPPGTEPAPTTPPPVPLTPEQFEVVATTDPVKVAGLHPNDYDLWLNRNINLDIGAQVRTPEAVAKVTTDIAAARISCDTATTDALEARLFNSTQRTDITAAEMPDASPEAVDVQNQNARAFNETLDRARGHLGLPVNPVPGVHAPTQQLPAAGAQQPADVQGGASGGAATPAAGTAPNSLPSGQAVPQALHPAHAVAQQVVASVEQSMPRLKGKIAITLDDHASGGAVTNPDQTVLLPLPDIARAIRHAGGNVENTVKILHNIVARHEAVHVVTFQAEGQLWEESDKSQTLEEFTVNFRKNLAKDLFSNPAAEKAARQIYGKDRKTGEWHWDKIKTPDMKAGEFLRMLIEARLDPERTEDFSELYRSVTNHGARSKIAKLIRTAIEMLTGMKFSDETEAHIKLLESLYRELTGEAQSTETAPDAAQTPQNGEAQPSTSSTAPSTTAADNQMAQLDPAIREKLLREDWNVIAWTWAEINAVNAALGDKSPFVSTTPETKPTEPPAKLEPEPAPVGTEVTVNLGKGPEVVVKTPKGWYVKGEDYLVSESDKRIIDLGGLPKEGWVTTPATPEDGITTEKNPDGTFNIFDEGVLMYSNVPQPEVADLVTGLREAPNLPLSIITDSIRAATNTLNKPLPRSKDLELSDAMEGLIDEMAAMPPDQRRPWIDQQIEDWLAPIRAEEAAQEQRSKEFRELRDRLKARRRERARAIIDGSDLLTKMASHGKLESPPNMIGAYARKRAGKPPTQADIDAEAHKQAWDDIPLKSQYAKGPSGTLISAVMDQYMAPPGSGLAPDVMADAMGMDLNEFADKLQKELRQISRGQPEGQLSDEEIGNLSDKAFAEYAAKNPGLFAPKTPELTPEEQAAKDERTAKTAAWAKRTKNPTITDDKANRIAANYDNIVVTDGPPNSVAEDDEYVARAVEMSRVKADPNGLDAVLANADKEQGAAAKARNADAYRDETPDVPSGAPKGINKTSIRNLVAYLMSGNKGDIAGEHANFLMKLASAATQVIDAFGGAGIYTHLLAKFGLLPEGSVFNEWTYTRSITNSQMRDNPTGVATAVATLYAEYRRAFPEKDLPKTKTEMSVLQQRILDWFNGKVSDLVGPNPRNDSEKRLILPDNAKTAALYLLVQNFAYKNYVIDFSFPKKDTQVTGDNQDFFAKTADSANTLPESDNIATIPMITFGEAALGKDHLILVQQDTDTGIISWNEEWRVTDHITKLGAFYKDVASRLRKTNITQQDGWKLAANAKTGALVFVDPSYFLGDSDAKGGRKSKDIIGYGGVTETDKDWREQLEKVREFLIPNGERVRYVYSNNFNSQVVEALEKAGWTVLHAVRNKTTKENTKKKPSHELIALSPAAARAAGMDTPLRRQYRPGGIPIESGRGIGGQGIPETGLRPDDGREIQRVAGESVLQQGPPAVRYDTGRGQTGELAATGDVAGTPGNVAEQRPADDDLSDILWLKSSPAPDISAQDVLSELSRTRMIPAATASAALGDSRPKYLDGVIDHIMQAREKLVRGQLAKRDVAKAYILTQGSIGSDGRLLETVNRHLSGLNLPAIREDYADMDANGKLKVRPEHLTAWWLMTPQGKAALDALENGQVDKKAFSDLASVLSIYGKDNFTGNSVIGNMRRNPQTNEIVSLDYGAPPAAGKFNLTNLASLTEAINSTLGDTNRLLAVLVKTNGIGDGKKGFIGHLLGVGNMPTVDAVELNFWLTGKGTTLGNETRQAKLVRSIKENLGDSRVSAEITRRITQRIKDLRKSSGDAWSMPDEVAGAIIHHMLWDRAKGIETDHRQMYEAMALASSPEPEPLNIESPSEALTKLLKLGDDYHGMVTRGEISIDLYSRMGRTLRDYAAAIIEHENLPSESIVATINQFPPGSPAQVSAMYAFLQAATPSGYIPVFDYEHGYIANSNASDAIMFAAGKQSMGKLQSIEFVPKDEADAFRTARAREGQHGDMDIRINWAMKKSNPYYVRMATRNELKAAVGADLVSQALQTNKGEFAGGMSKMRNGKLLTYALTSEQQSRITQAGLTPKTFWDKVRQGDADLVNRLASEDRPERRDYLRRGLAMGPLKEGVTVKGMLFPMEPTKTLPPKPKQQKPEPDGRGPTSEQTSLFSSPEPSGPVQVTLTREIADKIATNLIEGGINSRGIVSLTAEGMKVPMSAVTSVKRYLLRMGNRQDWIDRHADMIMKGWDDDEVGVGKTFRQANQTSLFSSPEWSSHSEQLWRLPEEQTFTSAETSINSRTPAAGFKTIKWQQGTINADIGGGRFDNATEYLAPLGVENVIYDPFNRDFAHNKKSASRIHDGQADTSTVFNVLNVIMEPELRELVIRQAANAIKPTGSAYFQIYEGDKTGDGRPTPKGWQENRSTASYVDEISRHFQSVSRFGGNIVATRPMTNVEPIPEPVQKQKIAVGQMSLFSSPSPESPFYSQLARTIEAKMPSTAPIAQVVQIAASGAKAEEIKWSGLVPALQGMAKDGKVQKDQVLRYLADEGAVRFEEVALGTRSETLPEGYEAVRDGGEWAVYAVPDDGDVYGQGDTREEAIQRANSYIQTGITTTEMEVAPRFSQYSHPGGENYREGLLWGLVDGDGPPIIQSSHWGQEHAPKDAPPKGKRWILIGHYRVQEFTDSDGNKGILIEEIQSDLHQAGRKKGYAGDTDIKGWKAEVAGDGVYGVKDAAGELQGYYKGTDEKSAIAEAVRSMTVLDKAVDGKIPDAPFRTTWPLALFKRALRDAVAGQKSWVGWTSGTTQNDRYDLSKQVDKIGVTMNPDGTYAIDAMPTGSASWQQITASSKAEELPDTIGKDLAQKIIADKFTPSGHMTYKGVDLKVGGSGMKGFYDVMLPKEIGKYVKQWGGSVNKSAIATGNQQGIADAIAKVGENASIAIDDEQMAEAVEEAAGRVEGAVRQGGMSYAEAMKIEREMFDDGAASYISNVLAGQGFHEANNKTAATTPIWRVDITPEMAKGVQQGQSLFSSPAPESAINLLGNTNIEIPANRNEYDLWNATEKHIQKLMPGFKGAVQMIDGTNSLGEAYASGNLGFNFASLMKRLRDGAITEEDAQERMKIVMSHEMIHAAEWDVMWDMYKETHKPAKRDKAFHQWARDMQSSLWDQMIKESPTAARQARAVYVGRSSDKEFRKKYLDDKYRAVPEITRMFIENQEIGRTSEERVVDATKEESPWKTFMSRVMDKLNEWFGKSPPQQVAALITATRKRLRDWGEQPSQDNQMALFSSPDSQPISPRAKSSTRHAELEAKHNAGTITPEETAEAERIVAERAKAASYNIGPVWHGSNSRFEVFNTAQPDRRKETTEWSVLGSFFTPSKEVADGYSKWATREKGGTATLYQAFVKLTNPIRVTPSQIEKLRTEQDARDARAKWEAAGHDGAILRERYGFDGTKMRDGEFVAFNPEQIKDASAFNGTRLDDRFKADNPSILRSSPDPDTQAAIAQAIAKMPPIHRAVLEEVSAGKSVDEVAGSRNMPPQAVQNILNHARAYLATVTAAASPAGLQPVTQTDSAGNVRYKGDASRYAGSTIPAMAAIEQIREESGVPGVVHFGPIHERARATVKADFAGTLERLARKRSNNEPFDLQDIAEAKNIIYETVLSGEDNTPENRANMAILATGYKDEGSDAARLMGIRVDPLMTPAERHALWIGEKMYTPDEQTRKRMKAANGGDMKAILAGWLGKIDQIKAELMSRGINLDASLKAFRDSEDARKEAEAQSPQTKQVMDETFSRLKASEKIAIKTLMSPRATIDAAVKLSRHTESEIKEIHRKFMLDVTRAMEERAKRYVSQALASSPEDGVKDILARLGLLEWDMYPKNEADRPRVEALKAKRKSKPRTGTAKPSGTATAPKTPAAPKAEPVDPNQIPIPLEGTAGPENPGDLAPFPAGPNLPQQGQQEMTLGGDAADADTTGIFDLGDEYAVKEVMDALAQATKATWRDKLVEFWRMSILTGPQTSIVNMGSNTIHSAYRLLPRRAAEAAANNALSIIGLGSQEAATFGEFSAMAKEINNAVSLGARLALKSWRLEQRGVFEAYAANEATQLEKPGVGRESTTPTMTGPIGKIMRMLSFRQMTMADEFMKGVTGHLEAAAQSHRIARVEEKLRGPAYEARIAELMEPGSTAWIRAIDPTTKAMFQEELRGNDPQLIHRFDQLATLAKHGRSMPWIGRPLTFALPFVDTPLNIFKMAVEVTPIGGALAVIDGARALKRKVFRGDMTQEEANAEASKLYNRARLVQDLTNQTICLMLYFALRGLVSPPDDDPEGLPWFTGTTPYKSTRKGERDNAFAVMPPMSFRVGNQIHSYSRIEPFATAFGSMVDYLNIMNRSGGHVGKATSEWLMRFKDQAGDKTFLQGVGNIMNVVENPDRGIERLTAGILSGFAPNFIRQPLREADTKIRDTKPPPDSGILTGIARATGYQLIPQMAPERISVWGETIDSNPGRMFLGNRVTDLALRLVDPTNTRIAPDIKPIDRWIYKWNLQTADSAERVAIQPINRSLMLTVPGEKKRVEIMLTKDEHREANQAAGEAALSALGTDWDQEPFTSETAERIKKEVQNAQTAERARIRAERLAVIMGE